MQSFVDHRLFEYALASAEQGSFRRAAAALNVQQSTVSRGVRSLEYHVGAELFERSHAGIRPTPAGNRFLEEATEGFECLRRAVRGAKALQRGEEGKITIGLSAPLAVLGDLFERFRERFGGVSVEIVESTSRANWTLVQQRTADIAFVVGMPGKGAIRSLHLRDERMMAVLPTSHPLADAHELSLDELHLDRFILGANGIGPDLREHLAQRAPKRGVEPRVQLHRVGHCNLINMVALGFGVTIAIGPPPRATTDGVVPVPLTRRDVMPLYAVWMDSNPNPALKGLLDIVRVAAKASDVRRQCWH